VGMCIGTWLLGTGDLLLLLHATYDDVMLEVANKRCTVVESTMAEQASVTNNYII